MAVNDDGDIGGTWVKGLFNASYILHTSPSVTWADSDSIENYVKTKNITQKQGCEFPWKPEDFNYTFNKYGFRSVEFEPSDKFKILVSGCSFTEGIGLPLDRIWPTLLSNMIPNSIVYNLGQGGHSNAYIARSIYKTIDILKPNLVAIFYSYKDRLEIFDHMLPGFQHNKNIKPYLAITDAEKPLYPKHLLFTANQNYEYQKNKLFVELVCSNYKTPLISLGQDDVLTPTPLSLLPHHLQHITNFSLSNIPIECRNNPESIKYFIARDGIHPGYVWQQSIAMSMFQQYQKLFHQV